MENMEQEMTTGDVSTKTAAEDSTVVQNKEGNSKKKKPLRSQIINIPVRIEIKPDGRLVWDVNSVHKTIAKEVLKNKNLSKAKILTKKDSSAIKLGDIKAVSPDKPQEVDMSNTAEVAVEENS